MSSVGGTVAAAPVASMHGPGSASPADFPVPAGREEEWRFTPLRRLRGLHKDAFLHMAGRAGSGVAIEVDAPPEVHADLVGVHWVGLDQEERLADGLPPFLPANRVSARAYASVAEATVVMVPKNTQASRPAYIRVTGEAAGEAAAAHLVIDVQPLGRATVVIDQRGSATYADFVEIVVGDGGHLEVVTIADWDDDAVQVSAHHATLGRDAHLRHVAVTLGGSLVRLSTAVRYAGPGGDAELYGISFATALPDKGGQHLEHRLFVDHDVPNCRSLVRYKGALSGDGARTVWVGDVLIRPEATGTDSYEYNRNLVLTDGARADSVPNLEILTGEIVGAGHASANGRLEDDHLFYLMARGIPEAEARRLVIRGFFGELIEQVSIPELRDRIATAIERELS
jgi:Fe-S cluster assembly protein SufD